MFLRVMWNLSTSKSCQKAVQLCFQCKFCTTEFVRSTRKIFNRIIRLVFTNPVILEGSCFICPFFLSPFCHNRFNVIQLIQYCHLVGLNCQQNQFDHPNRGDKTSSWFWLWLLPSIPLIASLNVANIFLYFYSYLYIYAKEKLSIIK